MSVRKTDRDIQYRTRFLCCLAASILVIIVAANIPVDAGWAPVGWYVVHPSESISVAVIEPVTHQSASAGEAPITRFEDGNAAKPPSGETTKAAASGPLTDIAGTQRTAPPLERLAGRRIFDVVNNMPTIVGGIGAYYIHIEYPEEALIAGIQGRLILSFVVEKDGRTTGVEVIHALHPACDSAAVRALRQTRFVPGRKEGEVVPVRMRLPVRFQIVESRDEPHEAKDV